MRITERLLHTAAAVALAAVLLTGCGGKGNQTQGGSKLLQKLEEQAAASGTVSSGAASSEAASVAEPVDKTSEFEAAFNAMSVKSEYASCKRYVMVNDYDGDGKQEAFGFFGNARQNGDYPQWDKLHVYYIASDGTISTVYDPDDEFSENDMLLGRPYNQKSLDPTDFSASYLTSGGQTFAMFEVGTPYSDYYTMALSVYNGKPTVSYPDADLYPIADGFFAAYGYDEQTIYAAREGKFVQVGTAASSELSSYDSTEKSTPEKAWQKYKSGILSWIEEWGGHSTQDVEEHFLCADYDGDGKEEAFAIIGEPGNDWGFSSWARIYYITPDGYIFCAVSYVENGELYGFLRNQEQEAAGSQNVLMTAGKQKFLLWELSAGGSGSTTLILGVKDGAPYQPEISQKYDMFQQAPDGRYVGSVSDFSKGYHDFIEYEFAYDAASGEFTKK